MLREVRINDQGWDKIPKTEQAEIIAKRESEWIDRIAKGEGVYERYAVGDVEWCTAIMLDGVRIAMTARGKAKALAAIGASLATEAEARAMFKANKHIDPVVVRPVGNPTGTSASYKAMQAHSGAIGAAGQYDNDGKLWLAGADEGKAINIGLVDPAHPNGIWQSAGHAHNDQHVDCTQTVRGVWRKAGATDKHDTEPSPASVQPERTKPGSKATKKVKAWQAWLNTHGATLVVDGKHGAKTEAASVTYESRATPVAVHDLGATSVVVPAPLPISFRQAKHFYAGRRYGPPIWIVMHTAETIEQTGSADALGRYAATMSDQRVASWHYAIDDKHIVQSVNESDTAFAAPGANERGIQIELAGYARQTPDEWDDDFSRTQLRLTAQLVAQICARWDIPIRRVKSLDLSTGQAGICGHSDVSYAFKRSTHYDPGKSFPWDQFIEQVKEFAS